MAPYPTEASECRWFGAASSSVSLASSLCRFLVGPKLSVDEDALGRPYGGLPADETEDMELDAVRDEDVGVGRPPLNGMLAGAGGDEFEARNSSHETSLLLATAGYV